MNYNKTTMHLYELEIETEESYVTFFTKAKSFAEAEGKIKKSKEYRQAHRPNMQETFKMNSGNTVLID